MKAAHKRALIISHSHPDLSKGGAEVAAHGLYRGLRETPGWDAILLARHGVEGLKRDSTPFVSLGDEHEVLFSSQTDHFSFSCQSAPGLYRHFLDFLHSARPDVVHFHHYWMVGLELIRAVKQYNPLVPVVITLHEYLAICAQNGQMVKTNGQLCRRSSPALCHTCLPQYSPESFFLREHWIKSFFNQVDLFVAPSQFLKDRYVQWGLPEHKVVVLENGQDYGGHQLREPEPAEPTDGEAPARMRFAYFGQINPFKGIDVLLEAYDKLPFAIKKRAQLEIHGGSNFMPDDFREKIERLTAEAHASVKFFGPYAPEDQARLIQGADWVVVPSIWWENSPMVIQEAFIYGKPVICADIGGMAEKVQHMKTGLHFRARNATDLARTLEMAATTPGLWEHLNRGISPPPSLKDSASMHAQAYTRLAGLLQSPSCNSEQTERAPA